eukprot:5385574-Prymnesium_polylepis.1
MTAQDDASVRDEVTAHDDARARDVLPRLLLQRQVLLDGRLRAVANRPQVSHKARRLFLERLDARREQPAQVEPVAFRHAEGEALVPQRVVDDVDAARARMAVARKRDMSEPFAVGNAEGDSSNGNSYPFCFVLRGLLRFFVEQVTGSNEFAEHSARGAKRSGVRAGPTNGLVIRSKPAARANISLRRG